MGQKKKIGPEKNFEPKKNFVLDIFLNPKNILIEKKFDLKEIVGSKKVWVKKQVLSKNKFWPKKKLRSKTFGLANKV